MNEAPRTAKPKVKNLRSLREVSQSPNSENPLTQSSTAHQGPEPVPIQVPDLISPVEYFNGGLHPEDILLGDGFLERTEALFLVAQSGIGKSSAIMQSCCCWACGQSAFDFTPYQNKSWRIVLIQNEDSRNDLHRQSMIVAGLSFNEAEKKLIHENFKIATLRGELGPAAFSSIQAILDKNGGCDILAINPLSAYAQGDLAKTEDAGELLYGQLAPLLDAYNCGAFLAVHTPKMTATRRDQQKKWTTFDWMYSVAGAATFTNYARGMVTIDTVGDSRTFAWRLSKRFPESGWPTELQHFKWQVLDSGCRLWVPASVVETQEAKKGVSKTLADLYKLVPITGTIVKATLENKAMDEEKFTRRVYEALLAEALNGADTPDELKLYQWDLYNPQGGNCKAIGRSPQPDDEKPEAVKARLKAEKNRLAKIAKFPA